MTAREKAFVQITTFGKERVEYVDGRLGSGRILLTKLRKTAIGRKEFNRIASIDEDWKQALFIACAAEDGVQILYKGRPMSAEQAHRYRSTGQLQGDERAVTEPPQISVVGLVEDRVLVSLPGRYDQLPAAAHRDDRFRDLQITVLANNKGSVLFGPFLRRAHLFLDVPDLPNLTEKFKLVIAELDKINRKLGLTAIGDPFEYMAKVLSERVKDIDDVLDRVADPRHARVSEFGWERAPNPDTLHRLKVLDNILSGGTKVVGIPKDGPVILSVGVGPIIQLGAPNKDRLTRATKRFDKKARKAGKKLKINNQ